MTRGATIPVEPPHLLNGWLLSLTLHSLLLCITVSWFHHSSIPMPPNLFHWEVTLVQSTQALKESVVPEQHAAQLIETTQPPQPIPATRQGQTPASHTRTVSEQPTGDKLTTAVPDAETLASVAQAAPQTESSFTNSTPTVPQTANAAIQHPDPLANATAQEPPTPATTDTASQSERDPVSAPIQPTAPQVMASAQSDTAPPSRADYSWLQRMIFQRLEDLKRSSRPRIDDVRPMKVLVKAIVSNEGNLLASEVVKSSGLPHIDQEAMALVQRAFPMQFDRPLDRQQVAMRIPITYSRE